MVVSDLICFPCWLMGHNIDIDLIRVLLANDLSYSRRIYLYWYSCNLGYILFEGWNGIWYSCRLFLNLFYTFAMSLWSLDLYVISYSMHLITKVPIKLINYMYVYELQGSVATKIFRESFMPICWWWAARRLKNYIKVYWWLLVSMGHEEIIKRTHI